MMCLCVGIRRRCTAPVVVVVVAVVGLKVVVLPVADSDFGLGKVVVPGPQSKYCYRFHL